MNAVSDTHDLVAAGVANRDLDERRALLFEEVVGALRRAPGLLLEDLLRGREGLEPELKGSVGEGPNQTNYSDRSSVRILAKFSFVEVRSQNSGIFARKIIT